MDALGNDTSAHMHHPKLLNYQMLSFHIDGVKGPLLIAVWILLGIIAKMVFHMGPVRKVTKLLPDSSLLLILGLVIGCFVHYAKADKSYYILSPEIFFPFLLPPIVLEAGYFMPNRLLFHNIGAVSCFAVLGTIFNTIFIGLSLWGLQYATPYIGDEALPLIQIFLFAALICAVDPVAVLAVFDEVHVNDNLNIGVFGESLFNDAVTVVLYHMFSSFIEISSAKGFLSTSDLILGPLSFFVVAIGGALIGLVFGFVASFISRFTNHVKLLEPLLVLLFGYSSYLVAEMIRLSSILAIVSYGQFVRQFVSLNFSKESKNTLNSMIKILANSSETVIFIFIGTSAWSDTHIWSTPFVLYTLLFCMLYRAIGVFGQCYVLNKTRIPKHRYLFRDQLIMAYGGLRGAIAYGLAASINVFENEDIKNMYLTTTIVVVIFTVFFQGSTIKPLVEKLGVERKEEEEPTILQVEFDELQEGIKSCLTAIVGHKGHSYMLQSIDQFNNQYFYPILLRKEAAKSQHLEERKQSMKDLYKMMQSIVTGQSFPKSPSTHSINGLDRKRFGSQSRLPRSNKSVINMVSQVHEDRRRMKKQLWYRNESMFSHNAWDDEYEEQKISVKKQRLQILRANTLTRKLSSHHLLDLTIITRPSQSSLRSTNASQVSLSDRHDQRNNENGLVTPVRSKSQAVSFHISDLETENQLQSPQKHFQKLRNESGADSPKSNRSVSFHLNDLDSVVVVNKDTLKSKKPNLKRENNGTKQQKDDCDKIQKANENRQDRAGGGKPNVVTKSEPDLEGNANMKDSEVTEDANKRDGEVYDEKKHEDISDGEANKMVPDDKHVKVETDQRQELSNDKDGIDNRGFEEDEGAGKNGQEGRINRNHAEPEDQAEASQPQVKPISVDEIEEAEDNGK